jgi:hypothetical protein
MESNALETPCPTEERRKSYICAVVVAALVVLGAVFAPEPAAAAPQNPIQVENAQQGTDAWQLGRAGFSISDDATGQIQGYASATSVNKGGQIGFQVSVNPVQNFTADFYRMGWYGGLGGRWMTEIGPIAGTHQRTCTPDGTTGMVDCGWSRTFNLTVPTTWTSGIFLVVLTNAQNYQSYMTFVVRDDTRVADFLYQQSVTTYQAYNNYPVGSGKSLYEFNSYGGTVPATGTVRAAKVSFDRPYSDGYGSGQLAGNSWNWERYMVGWLEMSGEDVTYSTDLDTNSNGARLLDFKGFLSVGHDEYWSKAMVNAATTARDAGVNLAFFGSNTAYWQVRFEASAAGVANRVMVCYKKATLDPVKDSTSTVLWRDPPVSRPEQSLVGVQYTAHLKDDGQGAMYVVRNSSNWVWNGTGLTDGAQIAGILGYETDRSMSQYDLPSNSSYTILADSPVVDAAGVNEVANTAVYQAPSGAWVFASGTNHWSFGLGKPGVTDARIQRATANILDRFLTSSPPPPTPPPAPSSLTATAVSSSTVDLSWSDNSSNESSFTVERSPDGTNWSTLTSLPADSTSYRDDNLVPTTIYRYRVKATNAAGDSAYTSVATVTTPAQSSVVFAESFPGADGSAWDPARWTTNTGTTASMDIQSGGGRMSFQNVASARAQAAASMTKYADTDTVASFKYSSTSPRGYFYVFTRGSGDWVSGYPNSSYFVQLTNDITTAQIWKSQAGVTTSLASQAGVASVTTAKQWVRLKVLGSTISLKVWTDGTSEPANWEMTVTDSSITTPGLLQVKWARGGTATAGRDVTLDDIKVSAALQVPSAPSGLTATAVSSSMVDLTWRDNATTETGYTVERSANGTTGWTQVNLPAGSTSYRDTGLAASTTYSYRVMATNEVGNSAYSAVATVTTPAAPPEIPAAPTGLTAMALSQSAIDLAWTDNATTEAMYTVERSPNGVTGWTVLTSTLAGGSTSYHDTGLSALTTYSYRVKATNAAGSSAYSNTATATTQDPPPQPPAAPSALSATAASSTAVDLAWTDNADNETGYTVERSPDGAAWTAVTTTLPAGTTSYHDTGLTPSTGYSYRVKATNAAGSSAYSNTATATTQSDVVFTETFPGANGSAWDASRWTVNTGTTASMDIQSGGGRMTFQNVSGARAQAIATMSKYADTDTVASFKYSSTSPRGYFYLFARGSGDWTSGYGNAGYFVQVTNDITTVQLWKSEGGVTTSLASQAGVATVTSAKQWIRFRVQGSTLSVKVWTDGTPEPANWELTTTDASITGPGVLQVKWARGGTATAGRDIVLDDIKVTRLS